ncbi:MAG TPA: glutaminyl-peptide cyclotransferase [Pseudonocardia sp.]|uniref:glutaminyl-peptide cyclotransferase n=1 Tax=Pseudonocardia sp. TaxID=60912 RepID=UPI002ED915E2
MPVPVTRALVTVLLSGLLVTGLSDCASAAPAPAAGSAAAITAGLADGVPRLHLVVLGTVPHDTSAWTEGLEIDNGTLYESTGLAGRSQLRELDPDTGRLRRASPLPDGLYGEGLTVLGDRIWQLTWQDGVALEWNRSTLTPTRRVPWTGEGWGLCHTADGRVIASDGSDRLRVLSGTDLAPLGSVAVRIAGRPVTGLNELECTPGALWANVYQTDWLVRIDPVSGAVTAAVDAAGLLGADLRAGTDVLNGIAAIPGTDQFLLTGKFWPTMFRVRFVS